MLISWLMDQQGRANLMASTESYLTPTDFFLWGFVKDTVYRENVQCVADLQRWITVAIAGYADSDVD
jgi:hypothetical protein